MFEACRRDNDGVLSTAIRRANDPDSDPVFHAHLLSLIKHARQLLVTGNQSSASVASAQRATTWIGLWSAAPSTTSLPLHPHLEPGWLSSDVFTDIASTLSFVDILPLPRGDTDVRLVPAAVLGVSDVDGATPCKVSASHLIRLGKFDGTPRFCHPWYVYVSEAFQAIVSIRADPEGPPLSNAALCALVDIARRNECHDDIDPKSSHHAGRSAPATMTADSALSSLQDLETQSQGRLHALMILLSCVVSRAIAVSLQRTMALFLTIRRYYFRASTVSCLFLSRSLSGSTRRDSDFATDFQSSTRSRSRLRSAMARHCRQVQHLGQVLARLSAIM